MVALLATLSGLMLIVLFIVGYIFIRDEGARHRVDVERYEARIAQLEVETPRAVLFSTMFATAFEARGVIYVDPQEKRKTELLAMPPPRAFGVAAKLMKLEAADRLRYEERMSQSETSKAEGG